MSDEIINVEEKNSIDNKKDDSELFPPLNNNNNQLENEYIHSSYNNIYKSEYESNNIDQNDNFVTEDDEFTFYKEQYNYLKDDNMYDERSSKLFGNKYKLSGKYENSSSSDDDFEEDDKDMEEYYKRKLHKKHNIDARVKLYKLNNENSWIDNCTGYVSIIMNVKCPLLKVIEEHTNKLIVKIRIKDYIYTLQNDTILMWKSNLKDENNSNDTALSFQNKKNLLDICDLIVTLYGQDKVHEIGLFETFNEIDVHNLENIYKVIQTNGGENMIKMIEKMISVDFFKKMFNVLLTEENRIIKEHDNENEEKLELNNKSIDEECIPSTSCESNQESNFDYISNKKKLLEEKLKNIKEINFKQSFINSEDKDIKENDSSPAKNETCYSVNQDENIVKKEPYFSETCEFINLKLIFMIYKYLLTLGNHQLIELMLNDSNYFGTFAALECKFFYYYLVSLESKIITSHREHFSKHSQFHNLLNINDTNIMSKIKLVNRLHYLRDVAIARFIDDLTLRSMNSLIHNNQNEIFQYVANSKELIYKLIFFIKQTVKYARREVKQMTNKMDSKEYDNKLDINSKKSPNKKKIKIIPNTLDELKKDKEDDNCKLINDENSRKLKTEETFKQYLNSEEESSSISDLNSKVDQKSKLTKSDTGNKLALNENYSDEEENDEESIFESENSDGKPNNKNDENDKDLFDDEYDLDDEHNYSYENESNLVYNENKFNFSLLRKNLKKSQKMKIYKLKSENLTPIEQWIISSPIKFMKELMFLTKDNMIKRTITETLIMEFDYLSSTFDWISYFLDINKSFINFHSFNIKLNKKNKLKRQFSNLDEKSTDKSLSVKEVIKPKNIDYELIKSNSFLFNLCNDIFRLSVESLTYYYYSSSETFKNYIYKNFGNFLEIKSKKKEKNYHESNSGKIIGKNKKKKSIVQILLNVIYFNNDFGIKGEITDLIKSLIDENNTNTYMIFNSVPVQPNNLANNSNKMNNWGLPIIEKANFGTNFFQHYSNQIITYISTDFFSESNNYNNENKTNLNSNSQVKDSKQFLLEIFNLSLYSNSIYTSTAILKNDMIKNILNIPQLNDKHLNLFLVKFIKNMMQNSTEEMFTTLSVKFKVFDVLFELLKLSIIKLNDNMDKNEGVVFNKEKNKSLIKTLGINILGSSIIDCFHQFKPNKIGVKYIETLLSDYKNQLDSYKPFTDSVIINLEKVKNNYYSEISKDNSKDENSTFFLEFKDEKTFSKKYLNSIMEENADDENDKNIKNDDSSEEDSLDKELDLIENTSKMNSSRLSCYENTNKKVNFLKNPKISSINSFNSLLAHNKFFSNKNIDSRFMIGNKRNKPATDMMSYRCFMSSNSLHKNSNKNSGIFNNSFNKGVTIINSYDDDNYDSLSDDYDEDDLEVKYNEKEDKTKDEYKTCKENKDYKESITFNEKMDNENKIMKGYIDPDVKFNSHEKILAMNIPNKAVKEEDLNKIKNNSFTKIEKSNLDLNLKEDSLNDYELIE